MRPAVSQVYSLVVVDEAHHIYRHTSQRDQIAEYTKEESTRLFLLSDISQSTGASLEYPPNMREVTLHEVVRCSRRIVQAAASFQIGGEAKLATLCHHKSDGPPLKSYLFNAPAEGAVRMAAYAEWTAFALVEVITGRGVALHPGPDLRSPRPLLGISAAQIPPHPLLTSSSSPSSRWSRHSRAWFCRAVSLSWLRMASSSAASSPHWMPRCAPPVTRDSCSSTHQRRRRCS